MPEQFIGEIRLFAGNFAPRGWAFCNGQILPINQHPALFSLLDINYGGNGRTTFALPDLRKRAPVHTAETNPERSTVRGLGKVSHIQGSSSSDGNQQSFLTLNYIIALEGNWPRRS